MTAPRAAATLASASASAEGDSSQPVSNASPPFPVVGSKANVFPGFAHAVLRRFDLRTLAIATMALAGLVIIGLGLMVGQIWDTPLAVKLLRLVETAVAGVFIFVAVVAADEAVDRGTPRVTTYAIAVIVASMIGTTLGSDVRQLLKASFRPPGAGSGLNAVFPITHRLELIVLCILVGGLATFVHVNRRTALAARRRQHEAERARARAQRRTLESQLQALQARVEPMFLFDTLERIRKLYRVDAAAAEAMLEDLIVYLRAALPHLRESTSTVSQEITLTHSWLDIVGRAARDWRIEFDIDEAARGARVPALVLLPLAQRAVADAGDAPLRLRLSVRVATTRLRIAVSTSTEAFGSGIAGQPMLEQIDDRLKKLYADDGSFDCRRASDAVGSEAAIELPLELAGDGNIEGGP